MKYRLNSPEANEGGSTPPEATYTQAQLDEAVRQAQTRSSSSGINMGKDRALKPFIEKAAERGFDVTDFGAHYDELLSLADVAKKNSNLNKESEKKMNAALAERDQFIQRYKDRVVTSELSQLASRSNNPAQVAKLLRADYKFDVVDQDGHEVVRVLGPDGQPVRKDAYTEMSLNEVVDKFLTDNPHFVPATQKQSVGNGQNRTSSPNSADGLGAILDKPANTWTAEERARYTAASKAGQIKFVGGVAMLA